MAIMTMAEKQEYIARLEGNARKLRGQQAEAYKARKGVQVGKLVKKLEKVYREIDSKKAAWGIQ